MFTVKKMHKRLHIVDESGTSVYTPPNFMRHNIPDREELQRVADYFNLTGQYDIEPVIIFEAKYTRKK